MKNILLWMSALIVTGGIVACVEDETLVPQEQPEARKVVVSATIGDVTRLALGESDAGRTKVEWSEGDAFALEIGEETYTFDWVEGNDFEYDGDNGVFPETFEAAGVVTAVYPAGEPAEMALQTGLRADVGNYMQLEAELSVAEGQSTEGLDFTFGHRTSVVEIALEKAELAGKDVVVDLRTIAESLYSTPAEEGVLSFDGTGKLTVYFAVSPTDAQIKDWHVGVKDIAGNDYYTATLSALQLASSKMYKVSKNADALTVSYLVSDDGKTVTAYDAIGLYKWAEMATADPAATVIDLELGDDITLPTEGITLDGDGLPDKGNWRPVQGGSASVPRYQGSIDGKEHTIRNMYIVDKTTATGHGFIGYSTKGTVQDLNFDNAKIVVGIADDYVGGGGKYVGVISGFSDDDFDNCHVTNSTLKCLGRGYDSQIMGGLVGELSVGKITNSSFTGTVEGYQRVGGLVGEQAKDTEIVNCTVSGVVDASMLVGGITGVAKGFVGLCTNEATVTGSESGGIAGQLSDHMGTYASCIIGCTNKGKINGISLSNYIGTGGIVGRVESYYNAHSFIIGCRNLSKEVYLNADGSSYGNYVAGVVGLFQNSTKTPTGVYGSYTVGMSHAANILYNSVTVGVLISGSTAVNESSGFVFDSETDADLTDAIVTSMNDYIESGMTAATSEKIIDTAYNSYRWSWTPGSWPVFTVVSPD